jgi:hypothetical protein
MEEWRYISGFDGKYMVSSYGKVKSVDRDISYPNGVKEHFKGKELYQTTVNSGYKQVVLYLNGKRYHKYVHQLVGNAFIDNPRGLTEINHKDYDKNNNHYNNLEWCTHLENIIDLRNKKSDGYKDSRNTNGTHKCVDCGKDVMYKSIRCRQCEGKHRAANNKDAIKKEDLTESLNRNKGNFTRASKEFGMTDNSLRKWCKKYGLPTHSKEWKDTH